MGCAPGDRDHLYRKKAGGKMKGYKTFKTTMGHKIRVRMSEEEIAERQLFHIVIVLFPFAFSVLMAAAWFGRW